MTAFDQDEAIAALDRLVTIAQSDTGQTRRVANFLLAWCNADECGGFDFADLWMLDRAIAGDILAVARLISIRHEYPTAYGLGPRFEQLVVGGRPQLVVRPKAGRAWTPGESAIADPKPAPPALPSSFTFCTGACR